MDSAPINNNNNRNVQLLKSLMTTTTKMRALPTVLEVLEILPLLDLLPPSILATPRGTREAARLRSVSTRTIRMLEARTLRKRTDNPCRKSSMTDQVKIIMYKLN